MDGTNIELDYRPGKTKAHRQDGGRDKYEITIKTE